MENLDQAQYIHFINKETFPMSKGWLATAYINKEFLI